MRPPGLYSLFNWFKTGKQVVCFCQSIERDAVTNREELIPHRKDVGIFVRSINRVFGFPFRDFNDGAVTCAYDRGNAIRHEPFLSESRNTTTH